jgi:hypothetical protein
MDTEKEHSIIVLVGFIGCCYATDWILTQGSVGFECYRKTGSVFAM